MLLQCFNRGEYFKKIKVQIALILSILSYCSYAQNIGEISGSVNDSIESIIGAQVVIVGNNTLGAITDIDGSFTIKNIPAGTYDINISFVGFETYTAKGVVVEKGKTTKLPPVTLKNSTQFNEVVVITKRNESSEISAVQDTKKSEKIISVLSNEQIQKGQDRDAAQAIRRIPGVSLVNSRFIMVRGLAQRYNSVWLNGAGAPSSETDSRAFSFDIIPSQLIDKIQVFKTAAPDLPGDFAGGMVKIYTRASAIKKEFQVNLQESYRVGSSLNTINYTTGGGPLDLLGFGSKYRALPSDVPLTNLNSTKGIDRNAISKSFGNSWGIITKNAAPDTRLNIYYADRIKSGKLDLGNTFNLNYANLHTIYKIHREDWDSTIKSLDYNDVQSTNTVRLGIVENFYARFNKNFKMEFRNLFNQFGIQQNTLRTNNLISAPDQKAYALSYQSRTIYSGQLTGDVHTNNEKIAYNWSLGYSHINKSLPDLRRIKYSRPSGSKDSVAYSALVPPGSADPVNGGGRFYSKLIENVYSFNQNLKWNLIKKANTELNMNVGSYTEYKSRSFSARTFGYTIAPSASSVSLVTLPIGQIFSDQNVGVTNGFKIDEITSKSDAYTAQNALIASYVSVSGSFFDKIKVLTGARFEHNTQSLQSFLNTSKLDTSVVTNFILPSLNISYSFTKKSSLRFAYGKTLNRPEFREWSPFYFYNFEFNAGTYGSLFPTILSPRGKVLDVCKIDNFDMRYEIYPSRGEMITFGAFYKHLTNPIQQVVLNGTDDSRNFSFANAKYAYIAGIEIDIRKNLGFIGSSDFFDNLDFVSNLSLIKSQVTLGASVNQNLQTPLQGQSPYVVNAGFYYKKDSSGIQASVLYNVFGPRIFLFGTKNYPSYGEMPRNSLDIMFSKNISKKCSITLGVQNLLNYSVLLVQDSNGNGKFERPKQGDDSPDKIIMKYKQGSYYTLGVKFNL